MGVVRVEDRGAPECVVCRIVGRESILAKLRTTEQPFVVRRVSPCLES